jgi:hypothetical protein
VAEVYRNAIHLRRGRKNHNGRLSVPVGTSLSYPPFSARRRRRRVRRRSGATAVPHAPDDSRATARSYSHDSNSGGTPCAETSQCGGAGGPTGVARLRSQESGAHGPAGSFSFAAAARGADTRKCSATANQGTAFARTGACTSDSKVA